MEEREDYMIENDQDQQVTLGEMIEATVKLFKELQEKSPTRENAIVVTNLETAMLWHEQDMVVNNRPELYVGEAEE